MRPYLAIIKDSFREAVASRVLWVMLGLISLTLLLLLPLGVGLHRTTEFARGDIHEPHRLVDRLRRAALAAEPSPAKRVWSQIDPDTRRKMAPLWTGQAEGNRQFFPAVEALRDGLNDLVKSPDLYEAASWNTAALPKEARDLLDKPRGKLTKSEAGRLNRLLIEAAAPGNFARRAGQSVGLSYFFGLVDLSGPLPISKEQADRIIKEWIISGTISVVVGVLGVIAAILVTSTVMPQMFEPGSINLLLSKPISRSLLFLSKFVGACAFILLNVAYLLGGLWLILGTRFDIWNRGILLCIPIFLFLFLVYYSVSALAGVIWKNAVISVVLTVVFWAACFFTGTTKEIFEQVLLEQQRITRLTQVDDSLVAVTESGRMQVWDEANRTWQQVQAAREGGGVPTIDGPYFHRPTQQLLLGQGYRDPFGFAGQRITLRLGKSGGGWQMQDGPGVPSGTSAIALLKDGTLLAVAADDVYRLRGNLLPAESQLKLFGVPILGGGSFVPLDLGEVAHFADPVSVATNPQQPQLIICSGNEVTMIGRRSESKFEIEANSTLAGSDRDGAAVAATNHLVMVAREDGRVWLLAPGDLSVLKELRLEPYSQPRFAAASPDGRWLAVLFHNRRLWLLDGQSGSARLAPIRGQNDISGFAFGTAGDLLVADRVNRVTNYKLPDFVTTEVRWQEMNRFELAYYYSILPLYTLMPKPGEVDNTVHYLLTGKRTTDAGFFQGDLTQKRAELHPWRPVVSGLAFVALMLLVSCVYLEWHQF